MKGKLIYDGYDSCHSHSIAQVLTPCHNHEKHFGLILGNKHKPTNGIYIETVEHADAIIVALREAIEAGELFTEDDIEQLSSPSCNTREKMIEARREHDSP